MKRKEQRTDEQLIELFKKGDNQSMGELYGRYYNKVYRKCLSTIKNSEDAFDLTQDILLKTFARINKFSGDSSFSTWLFSITHNQCMDFLRKRGRRLNQDIDDRVDLADEETDVVELEAADKREELSKQVVDQLPTDEKELLLAKYEQNLSIQDLMGKYGLSSSAVKMRLARARQKAQDLLNGLQPAV